MSEEIDQTWLAGAMVSNPRPADPANPLVACPRCQATFFAFPTDEARSE